MDFLTIFVAILSLANPASKVPIFITMTDEMEHKQKTRFAAVSAVAVAAILLVAMFIGTPILEAFGISIPSFRIAGGIVLLIAGLMMMFADEGSLEKDRELAGGRITQAVVLLALPMTAGPGAIAAVILYSKKITLWGHAASLGGAILAVSLVFFLILLTAPAIARMLGKTGMQVMTKIMGLLITAIGVEFITKGLAEVFPKLVS